MVSYVYSIASLTPVAFQSKDIAVVEGCIGCGICQKVCPTGAISFTKDENGKVSSYTVDLKKCMFCGNCEYYCPKGAIKLTKEYELATDDIDELVLKYNGGCND